MIRKRIGGMIEHVGEEEVNREPQDMEKESRKCIDCGGRKKMSMLGVSGGGGGLQRSEHGGREGVGI